jgi:hypothetical protein
MRFQSYCVGCVLLVMSMVAGAAEEPAKPSGTPQDSTALRYTFSYPLSSDTKMKPRGGTTRGPEVTYDRSASAEWQALQAPGISAMERDRRAILAMAGTYRVTFDFLEVMPFTAKSEPNRPYQSWGTERVYVDVNQDKLISLVHILEMRVVQQDGKLSDPFVTKHWRQDWVYEPKEVIEFVGENRWQRREIGSRERRGVWSQTVYQVDESPRYASVGRWEHSASFSTWLSGETWRPLPRREWSVRKDYNVLIGTNRHTISPSGWVQEENNLKAVVGPDRAVQAAQPYVAREYGVARYERIIETDDTSFAQADDYFARTRQFWNEVRNEWSRLFAKQGQVTLKGAVDQLGLFQPLFARADELSESKEVTADTSAENLKVIRTALTDMGAMK